MAKKRRKIIYLVALFVIALVLFLPKPALGADTEGCAICHGQSGFNTVKDGKTVSLYVDADKYDQCMHKDNKCSDCHMGYTAVQTTSAEGPHSAEQTATYAENALASCQKCHDKAASEFAGSPHGEAHAAGNASAPKCTTCHETHYTTSAKAADSPLSKLKSPEQVCRPCHEEAFKTYHENYHGKTLVEFGYERSASCADCHGAHAAYKLTNKSGETETDITIDACKTCHEGANTNFIGYAVHGDENDREKYPMMFFAKWIMTFLLIFALGFFYLHSLMWAVKDISVMRAKKRENANRMATNGGEAAITMPPVAQTGGEVELYRRFNWFHITMHYLMVFTFMALVFTGMPLRYRGAAWAKAMITTLGGAYSAGIIHRIAAGITLFYFIAEVVYGIGYCYIIRRDHIFGPNSMFPRWKDLKDLGNNMKYFVGRGSQPKFDRYTYWEKFDYLAVFWGMFAIGATGLFLWFPTFFAKLIPGQIFNVATIMHSDEAVLAAFFIFIVHWFNTHWRPGKFPMDPVIFTGKVTKEELMHERPLEWERIQSDPELKAKMRVKK